MVGINPFEDYRVDRRVYEERTGQKIEPVSIPANKYNGPIPDVTPEVRQMVAQQEPGRKVSDVEIPDFDFPKPYV